MGYGFYRDEEIEPPHKPIPLAMFLIAEEAIRVSWQRLKDRLLPRIDLRTADEDEVTHDLYEVLFDEVFGKGLVDGFDNERFTVVTREAKLRNYNGSLLDKMPDLLIGVAGRSNIYRRTQDWLFIECKPIDVNHSVGVHYGAKGISRFTRGDYAWTMTSALMIGYASSDYRIDPKLTETLVGRGLEFEVLDLPKICPRSVVTLISEAVYTSRHRRPFTYVETEKIAPPILLRHLWLQRPTLSVPQSQTPR